MLVLAIISMLIGFVIGCAMVIGYKQKLENDRMMVEMLENANNPATALMRSMM